MLNPDDRMSTLIFITSRFPYLPGEAFIDPEFNWLCSAFNKKIIITRNVRGDIIRPLPDDIKVHRYNPSSLWHEYLFIPVLVLRNLRKVVTLIKEEVFFRKLIGKHLRLNHKLFLLRTIIKSLQLRDFISNVLNTEKPEGEVVIYSYWMNSGARAICLLDKFAGIRISRAHRIDLYEQHTKQKYLPLLKFMFLNLDAIFFISVHGKEYFENLVQVTHEKNIVSRLGINNDHPFNPGKQESSVFRIVSCSSMIPVKRIDLLITALGKVRSSKQLVWNHFGEGILKNELSKLAREKLGDEKRIKYRFMGYVSNQELMQFYSTNTVDLFINTSASEGIPVSIMEAQSFGIPVIATDAGGTAEIVVENTGVLLPVEFRTEDLVHSIEHYINMKHEDITEIRKAAYKNWKLNFDASVNFEKFIINIKRLSASRKIDRKYST